LIHLTVSAQRCVVSSLPGSVERATLELVGSVSLDTEASVLATSRGEATVLSVLVHSTDDPVDSGVIADSDVVGVNQNYLIVLESGILVNPIGVQDTHVTSETPNTVLSNRAQVALELQVVNTSIHRLTVHDTAVVRSLASSAANGNTVHRVTLLGLVAKLVCLVGTGRVGKLDDFLALAVLPRSVFGSGDEKRKKRKNKVSACKNVC